MALISCYECTKEISDTAASCPNCGAPSARHQASAVRYQKKQVGPLRKLAIIVFWGFIGLSVLGYLSSQPTRQRERTPEEQGIYSESSASYREADGQVGCKSQYSDEKKDDLFNELYRNKWMTWKGKIVLLESGRASLDIDGIGTQDISLKFENESAGYDLTKGRTITVRFVMRSAGGCFLPFSGDKASIVN